MLLREQYIGANNNHGLHVVVLFMSRGNKTRVVASNLTAHVTDNIDLMRQVKRNIQIQEYR